MYISYHIHQGLSRVNFNKPRPEDQSRKGARSFYGWGGRAAGRRLPYEDSNQWVSSRSSSSTSATRDTQKSLSWQTWHMREILYSRIDRRSRKSLVLPVGLPQVAHPVLCGAMSSSIDLMAGALLAYGVRVISKSFKGETSSAIWPSGGIPFQKSLSSLCIYYTTVNRICQEKSSLLTIL